MHDFERFIRAVPDFPQTGILFRDLTPALENPRFPANHRPLRRALRWPEGDEGGRHREPGLHSRATLAYALGAGFSVFRKPGKLPRPTRSESYQLEYGQSTLHMHTDASLPTTVSSSSMTWSPLEAPWPPRFA